jgi:hypothetical protein
MEPIMSHISLDFSARPAWLTEVLDWMRHARVAAHLEHADIADLADRDLRDIGAVRKDVARAMDREKDRLSLLDVGWPARRDGNRQ